MVLDGSRGTGEPGVGRRTSYQQSRYIFFEFNNNQQMFAQGLTESEDRGMLGMQTSFQKCSLNTTEIQSHYSRGGLDIQFNSAQTMESLPFNSRAMDFEEASPGSRLDQEVGGIQLRFKGIHKILIDHSEFQSDLHERRRGYRMMKIDHSSLGKDFSNKVQIIGDITALIESIQTSNDEELTDLLQTKFQQYYLERHYGGLSCEFGNLSIQERLDSSSPEEGEGEGDENIILSKIGNFQSLIPQSKLTYSEQFCQTQGLEQEIFIPVTRIIEVEIPVMVYKIKEMIVKYDESDLCHNIDDIITKYSRPYQEIYENGEKGNWEEGDNMILGPNTVPHTPMQSHLPSLLSNYQITEIELAYSDFPEEDNLKLPLDSYAQIESLISNSSRPETDRERPPTDRETPISEGTIFITQKIISRSIIQKYEESERALVEQNSELKEWIENLRTHISQAQKKQKQLECQNKKLAHQLEEEIQQTEYYSSKLDELDVELLEEKVQCLTHLNQSKERKIQLLNNEILDKKEQIEVLNRQLADFEFNFKLSEDILLKKDEEINSLTKLLEEKEMELNDFNSCEQNVIKMASETEISLKDEIQKLEREKGELSDNLRFFKQRLQHQGLSLQIEEATEIQGIIEQREHHFSLQLQQINKKYDEILSVYQKELTQLKVQLEKIKATNQHKSILIKNQSSNEIRRKAEAEQYFKEFQAIIEQYNSELESKDEEILTLKKKSSVEIKGEADIQMILERSSRTIEVLEKQLLVEREHKAKLTGQLIELDRVIRNEIENIKMKKNNEEEARLLEELSLELEKKLVENSQLKQQISAQTNQIIQLSQANSNSIIGQLKQENIKLRKVNGKLKRYTVALEEQIRSVCGIDECESHKNEINRLMQDRDFYLNLATQCQTSANPFLC